MTRSLITSWADLTINKPGAEHGDGDYLVCRKGADGKPDLSDVLVVNGMTFGRTYNTREDLNMTLGRDGDKSPKVKAQLGLDFDGDAIAYHVRRAPADKGRGR